MITQYRWNKLKDGDKIWIGSPWLKFPMPGVVKKRPKGSYVHVNFFGDAQMKWRPGDKKRMLWDLYMRKEDAEEARKA